MTLTIGENIRNFRKKNDMTQEALANRLGVTYQSISRWENGTTYPDLELLPAISEVLSVTVDELLGMPKIEKEKRAVKAFDELRRECIKRDYDAERIVSLLRDIRRNYLDSSSAWRPWCEGNDRAFRDPNILPEVRLLAEAYLERHPMFSHTIQTMAKIETEENLKEFLKKYSTPFDCSSRALLFSRYYSRKDNEGFARERRYQLYEAFNTLITSRYLLNLDADKESKNAADEFMEDILYFIRRDAIDNRPDIWICDRIELGLKKAARLLDTNQADEAISVIGTVVDLLETISQIKEETPLPTSCRFLEGMEWWASIIWFKRKNDPDSPQERMIGISSRMDGMTIGYNLHPSDTLDTLQRKEFDSLRENPEFKKLCERVEALIVTKPTE